MRLVGFALLLAFVGAASGQPADPDLGVWELNKEKTALGWGRMPHSLTLTVETDGKGVRNTAVGVASNGAPINIRYTAYYDGQDWPFHGYLIANTASTRRIDARTSERIDKLNGKAVQTATRTVSPDGRQMTVVVKGDGYQNTYVYDRR